jgi:hypothetical protein
MHTTGRRERETEESNRKREKSIIQKKKEKSFAEIRAR